MSKLPYVNQSIIDEHDDAKPETKKVLMYGWDIDNTQKTRVVVNVNGELGVTIDE